jgi:predicted metal-dependent hydrolase
LSFRTKRGEVEETLKFLKLSSGPSLPGAARDDNYFMEEKIFIYGKYKFNYFIFREDRKSISLRVTPKLKVIVRCPSAMNEKALNEFLKKKYDWVAKQMEFFKKFEKKKEKEYISGEAVLYLGRQYKLIVKKGLDEKISLKGGEILLSTNGLVGDGRNNKLILDFWYNERVKEIFRKRLKEILKKFNYNFAPILLIRKMDKKWGSFSGQRKLTLNPKLIQAPRECIDYVIVHELCHFKYRDHSQKFYRLLESKLPEWEKIKEKLEMRFL